MKNNFSHWLSAVLVGGIILNANAAPLRNKRKPVQITYRKVASARVASEKSFYLFGGINLGYAMYSKSDAALLPDGSRSGIDIGVDGLASFYLTNFVFDGGFGFAFLSSSGTSSAGAPISVKTRTLYLDFSPRYRLDENWQIGPELQFWLGGDKGLDPNLFSESNNALMGGAIVAYEWMTDATKYRVGARWNMDFNISDRNLNVIQAFFQIGFGPGSASRERPQFNEELKETDIEKVQPEPVEQVTPEPAPEPEVQSEPEVMSTPAPVEEPAPMPIGPQEKMVVTLDVQDLPFESNSARLPKYNRDRVQEIGRFLGEHKSDWNNLLVVGHTDEQGNKAYNLKLSKARAETVRQLLGEGGAPLKKIKAVGYGSNRPIDRRHNEKAWSKNRRVELEFKGVKDGLQIQKAFQR